MKTNTTNTAWQSSSNCPHKLPCGLCRLTMMNCPKGGWTYTTTWGSTGDSTTISTGDTTATINSDCGGSEK